MANIAKDDWMEGRVSTRPKTTTSEPSRLPRLSYAPYGEPLEAGRFGSPFTFTGELTDDNDLMYLRARYYSPALGVFTALDPVENLNRYQYVGANPANRVDLSGSQDDKCGAYWGDPQGYAECTSA